MPLTYEQSGVNINAGSESVERIKKYVQKTFDKHVLTGIGSFGSLYDLAEITRLYKHPVLVQSTDSVGTKVMIAAMMRRYDTIGRDLVAHCSNDILAMGAKPLTLLDYIATSAVSPDLIEDIVKGVAEGCREAGISLVGGETAELPGVYQKDEFDLAGAVAGVVEKDKIITGKTIKPGDVVLGFASSGLHTNGYSLARKLLFELGGYTVDSRIPELEKTVGETLLRPHINYIKPVHALLEAGVAIKGIAHITGGGFIDNIPRILPDGTAVEIKKGSWPVPPIFTVMQRLGSLEEKELYRTFNMGVGMVVVVSVEDREIIKETLQERSQLVYEIGQVVGHNLDAVRVALL